MGCLFTTSLQATNLLSDEKKDVNIIVEGVTVTPENASNVLAGKGMGKDGCISYNYTTHTLTLNNAQLDGSIYISHNEEETYSKNFLPIMLEGKNSIKTTDESCITTTYPIVISGGELTLNPISKTTTAIAGIYIKHYLADIVLRGCSVNIPNTKYPIATSDVGDGRLIIDGAKFHSKGYVGGFYLIEVNHSSIETAGVEVAELSNGDEMKVFYQVFVKDGKPYDGDLHITPDNNVLPLLFMGERLTTTTAQAIKTKSGKASYNDKTQTLTLDNCTIENDYKGFLFSTTIDAFQPKVFKVELIGKNTITNEIGLCFKADASITFTGNGTLVANANKKDVNNACLYIDNRFGVIRIEKDASVTLEGGNGIFSLAEETLLEVDNAKLELIANKELDGAAMLGIGNLVLSPNCLIVKPQGGIFDPELGTVTSGEGKTDYAPHVIIAKNKEDSAKQIESNNGVAVTTTRDGVIIKTNNGLVHSVNVFLLNGEIIKTKQFTHYTEIQLNKGTYLLNIDGEAVKVAI